MSRGLITELNDEVDRLYAVTTELSDENDRLRARIAELLGALEPFAVGDRVSLIDTLGHINREHIAAARAAIAKAKGEQ